MKDIYKLLVRAQLALLFILYGLIAFKFWFKHYEPKYYDSLLFGRIPFFWFFHLVAGGVLLLLLAVLLLKKLNSREVIFWEVIIFVTLTAFLGIAEIYFRLKPAALPLAAILELGFNYRDPEIKEKIKSTMVDKYNDDRELGIIHKPNLSFEFKCADFSYRFQTDSQGFQNFDNEDLYNRADIVILGDSFAEGAGVPAEFSYPRQLAKLLNSKVLNLGHGNHDCYQYPIIFKRYGLKTHPKIVIVTIWSLDDIQGRYFKWAKANQEYGYTPYPDYQSRKAKKDKRKSYALVFLKVVYCNIVERYKGWWNYGAYRGVYVHGQRIPIRIMPLTILNDEELKEDLGYLENVLMEMKSLSQANNFRLITLYIPEKQEIYHRFLVNLPKEEKDNLDRARITISQKVKETGVEFFDSTPALLEAAKQGKQLYQVIDDHLNQDGYYFLAGALAQYLKKTRIESFSGKDGR